MSIDVEIIPVSNACITWIDLKSELLSLSLSVESSELLGEDPNLLYLKDSKEVENKEAIVPTNYYCFQLLRSNTLVLSCERNAEMYTDEEDFLENFGQNIDIDSRAYISHCWSEIGVEYAVESRGGRVKGESELLVAIAGSIAKLLNGFVAVKENDVFSIPVGLYSPEAFLLCKPLF